jgi:hypothetical protein
MADALGAEIVDASDWLRATPPRAVNSSAAH